MAFTARNGGTQTSLADINITPFVDVVLVLLIIFMLTAPILQSGIEVSVPKTKTVKEITQDRLVLTIDASKRVYLGDQPININEIPATLKRKQRGRDQVIYIRADESIPFGVFATVMDSVKQGGITNVSIVTQPYSQTGKSGGL
jgi:biopolymer transport protein TolR